MYYSVVVRVQIAITHGTVTVRSVFLNCDQCINGSSILCTENVVGGVLCERVHAIAILRFQ